MFKRKQFDPESFDGKIIKCSCSANLNTLWLLLVEGICTFVDRKNWNVKNRNFQAGDLVPIAETGASRSIWPLARIIEVKTSSDGTGRVAKVNTHYGVCETNRQSMFSRGVSYKFKDVFRF